MASLPTPEAVSEVTLQQVQQVLDHKDQMIRDLQNLMLFDDRWEQQQIIQPMFCSLRRSADAVADGESVYLRQAESEPSKLHQYLPSAHEFQDADITNLPVVSWSMAYHQNKLIVIGGVIRGRGQCSNELFSIGIADKSATKVFQDMPTRRSRSTAITCSHEGTDLLIVIGGEDDSNSALDTVEILNMVDGTWYIAPPIPETLCCASGTIAKGYIYVLGGWTKRDHASSAVFRCRLDALIQTMVRQQAAMVQQFPTDAKAVWERLPDLPVVQATCTTHNNDMIVVGGRANTVAVHDIRCYNEVYKHWQVVGYLPNSRYLCFAVGLPDKLVVIGGRKDTTSYQNTVEIYQ